MLLSLAHFYKQYKDVPEEIYKSMCSQDISECVITTLHYLEKTKNFMHFERNNKSTIRALYFIDQGKLAFAANDYQYALGFYNNALRFAPQNSAELGQAYFFRAKLFLYKMQPSACIKDVETCLELTNRDILANQLKYLKESAIKYLKLKQACDNRKPSEYEKKFFDLKSGRHSDIPCATSDIKIVIEPQGPKVVAATDIPVGTILAVEKPYVSSASNGTVFACHYCQKISLNLIPCPGCCVALFCDTNCQVKSIKEGHNIECKIIEFTITGDYTSGLPLKALLKMRQSSSWEDIIAESHNLGNERIKKSTVAETFRGMSSLLSSMTIKDVIYGEMFNTCMYFANMVHYLDIYTSFFPTSPEEKMPAIRATSRILMHLKLNSARIGIPNCISIATKGIIGSHEYPHFGYFPFIDKLKHACLPNSLTVGMNNTLALVSTMPIKKGDELTISHLDDWYTTGEGEINRLEKMMFILKKVCKCNICITNCKPLSEELKDTEMEIFQRWLFMQSSLSVNQQRDVRTTYTEVCKTMEAISRVPYSEEFRYAYIKFVQILMHFQNLKSSNISLCEITDDTLSVMNALL